MANNQLWVESACTLDYNRNINLIDQAHEFYKIPKSTISSNLKLEIYTENSPLPLKILEFLNENNKNNGIHVQHDMDIIAKFDYSLLVICDNDNILACIARIPIKIYQHHQIIESSVATQLCVKHNKRSIGVADMIIREYLIYLDKIQNNQHTFYLSPKYHHTCYINVQQWLYPVNTDNLRDERYGNIIHKHHNLYNLATIRKSISNDKYLLDLYKDKVVIHIDEFDKWINNIETYTILTLTNRVIGIFSYQILSVKKENNKHLNFLHVIMFVGYGYSTMLNFLYNKFNKNIDAIFGYCVGHMTKKVIKQNNGIMLDTNQVLEIHGASIKIKETDYFGIIL